MYNIDEIKNTILTGHVLDVLKNIPDESVDLGITSPPYYAQRNYGTPSQVWGGDSDCVHNWNYEIKKGITGGTKSKKVRIKGTENFQIVKDTEYATCFCGAFLGELGQEPNVYMYLSHLEQVFFEFRRVLKPTGSLWVNIGDKYGPNKSLYAIPSRFHVDMVEDGWINRNEIIWHKDNQMPSSIKDRFTVDFEKFFWFTKSKRYYFKQQIEPYRSTPDHKLRDKNSEKYDGTGLYSPGGRDYYSQGGRNKRAVWTINTRRYKGAHFATFPPELVKTPIAACCPEGGIVLDMFFGAGTTGLVAEQMNRNWIGIELGEDSVQMAHERLDKVTNS
jgi:site-specific DNA-methyltransferase (cytosine-N4-specific)